MCLEMDRFAAKNRLFRDLGCGSDLSVVESVELKGDSRFDQCCASLPIRALYSRLQGAGVGKSSEFGR